MAEGGGRSRSRRPGGPADELARARVQLATKVADATRLGSLGSPLRSMTDIQSALDEVLRTVRTLLDAKSAVLMLYDAESDELFPRASLDVPDEFLALLTPVTRPIGARGTGLATIEPLLMEDTRLSPLLDPYAAGAAAAGIRAIYSTPLLTLGSELMGTIAAFFPDPHRPEPRQIELVEAYARQTAEMVERARMHGEARQLAALERRRGTQLRALADTALALSSAGTADELVRIAKDAVRDVLGGRTVSVSRTEEPAAKRPRPGVREAPLVARDGGHLGLIRLSGRPDETWTAEDEAVLVQLARMTSVAIENVELIERERAARAEAEGNARLRGLLADASQAFAASLEVDATLATISDLTVPDLADWICVYLLGETGQMELAYVHHHDPYREHALRDELADSHAAPAGSGPQIVVPLAARGRTFGSLSLVREAGSPYTNSEYLLARELADRAALAVDNAARFAFERDVAATLQHSLLPQDLPLTPVVDVASRYLPGASGTRIGGDWYDVIMLDDGRVAMVVGDVMGRGVTAAAVMGQLRAAVRAYAIEGHGPAELLTRLDRVVDALGHAQLTTCLYAVYDPDASTLTVGAAGHLPPLVMPPDGDPWYPELDPGLPLGVGGATYADTTIEVAPGTVLVLYTDGLVEGPTTPIDEGLDALRRAAPRDPVSLDDLCDQVLRELGRDGDHDDDTALLAIRFTGAPRDSVGTSPLLELAPAPESVLMARRFVGEQIAALVRPEVAATAELLVTELVTNAIRHARSALAVRLVTLPHAVRVDVADESTAAPVARGDFDGESEDGRGILLIETLAERWGYEQLVAGKRVWFELARG